MSLQTPENGTIAEMWKNALAEFEQLVPDQGFKNLAVSTTPEDLRKKIEALNAEAEAKKSPNASRVKDIGLKVLEVIKTFGGVATEAVGTVFGPAQVCYGALSIFLSIPGKVREFHEFIDSVFIELNPVLSQFDIYIKMERDHSIHENLQTAIHKVMASFVHLCGKVISLQQGGKWERFKRHTKQILADDKELQEELEKFKRVVSGLHGIQITATYEGVVEIRAGVFEVQRTVDGVGNNVKKLVDEQDKRAKDDSKKRWLDEIRKFLDVKEEDSNNPKKRQDKMAGIRLKGTGNWLLKDEKFKKWAEVHSVESDPVLYLTGRSGFGKSTLLSAVIDQLRAQAAALGQERRSLISFHFLPAEKEKWSDQDNLAQMALKWVAALLAEQDDLLCKSMYGALKDRANEVKTVGAAGLWDLLKLKSASARTTNYLIFDDVDKFSKPAQQQFAKILADVSDRSEGQSSIKIIVAGDKLDAQIFGLGDGEEKPVIKVDIESMRGDFQQYINEKLRQKNMLPGPGCAELRQKLQDRLLGTQGCSFRTIDIAMKNIERVIASSGNEEQLFQAIDRSTQDEDDVIKETLAQLQSELGPAQIDLINNILVWVVYGWDESAGSVFHLSTLEAALRTLKVDLPIEGLANFIASKAQGLMRITSSGDTTTISLAEGAKKAIVKPRAVSRLTEPPRINLEIKLVNADLPTTRRFFWDLAKHVTLDQFDFSADSPSAQKGDTKGFIAINQADACLKMVQTTLTLFANPLDTKASALVKLGSYLVTRFRYNLKVLFDAKDLDALDGETKRKIGKFIYNLFANPRILEEYWDVFQFEALHVIGRDAMTEYWRWLEDRTATSGLGTKDEEWLKQCMASEDRTRELLADLMKRIATLWLLRSGDHGAAIHWIYGFIAEMWKPTPKNLPGDPTSFIPKAEAWCRELLGQKEANPGPLWYENLAKCYARFGLWKDAVAHYERAAALAAPEPASWNTMIGLSDALCALSPSNNTKQREAVLVKELAMEIYLGTKGSDIPRDDKVRELEDLAGWNGYLEEKEKAEKYRKLASDLAPDKPETQYALLKHYYLTRQHEKVQSALQAVFAEHKAKEAKSNAQPCPAGGLVREIVNDIMSSAFDPAFRLIVSAATDGGVLGGFLEGFEEAIEEARIKKANDDSTRTLHPMLVLHKGLVHMFNQNSDPREIKTSLETFAEAAAIAQEYHTSAKTPEEVFYERMSCVLGKYYFDEAYKVWRLVNLHPAPEAEAAVQQRRTLLEYAQKLEQTASDYEQAVPNGEITGGKCYVASLSTLRGNQKGARDIFRTDMVQVINMLSDDEQGNDDWALGKLLKIMLHSGDYENALVGYFLISIPKIGEKVPGRMRDALEKLIQPAGQSEEGSPAAQLLAIFDKERAADEPESMDSTLQKLIDEAAEHIAARKTDQAATTTTGTEGAKESSPETLKADKQDVEETSSDVDDVWASIHKTLVWVKEKELLGSDGHDRWCNNCEGYLDNGWNFDQEIYACKYCVNVDVCETCLQEIKAADPDKIHPVCHPFHDWLRLPRWTLDSWAESARMVVRLPARNEEGDLVLGDETMDMTAWLNMVTEPWGGLAAGKTWDHVKTPPPVPPKSESGSEGGEGGEDKPSEGEDEGKIEETNGKVEDTQKEKSEEGSENSEEESSTDGE